MKALEKKQRKSRVKKDPAVAEEGAETKKPRANKEKKKKMRKKAEKKNKKARKKRIDDILGHFRVV